MKKAINTAVQAFLKLPILTESIEFHSFMIMRRSNLKRSLKVKENTNESKKVLIIRENHWPCFAEREEAAVVVTKETTTTAIETVAAVHVPPPPFKLNCGAHVSPVLSISLPQ